MNTNKTQIQKFTSLSLLRSIGLVVGASLLALLIYLLLPLKTPVFPPDYSTVVTDKDGDILRAFLNTNEQWIFPPDSGLTVPDKLKQTVLLYEDHRFYEHPGVDLISVARAISQNAKAGEVVSGASTITMQVTRLMHPKPRTYFNKIREMLLAMKIETRYSKDAILELYLNHAPYGGNIIGYHAASTAYFQKKPTALTWAECATLAVLPNSPGLISPQTDPDKLRSKRDWLLARLQDEGIIDGKTYRLALLEPVPSEAHKYPVLAPHLSRDLYAEQQERPGIIRTTIDKRLQKESSDIVEQYMQYLQRYGINNAAVLVAETGSGAVRAYVGSQDFFDADHQGQVNGVVAPRSSGSLLKPFLYALSMDDGILLPQSLRKDIPSSYGAFSPENADENFHGIVTAREALIRSLNVPAVRLLYEYGIYSFYRFLQDAGLSTLFRSADDYGLPLIIGGAEVSLWDMAGLFRGLANGGQFGSLHVLQSAEKSQIISRKLMSPGAAYLTLDILRDLYRPGSEFYWHQFQDQWPIAWKTGTSYGQRDAWAIGVTPQWTIAVWVGNFTGEGNAELGGAKRAGPLLFDLFNTLSKDPELRWFLRPDEELKKVEICLDTGYKAGANCDRTKAVDTPWFMSSLKICPFHKRLYVDTDHQYQVCSLCWEPENYTVINRIVYPPKVLEYLRKRGKLVADIPPHNPECPEQGTGDPLEIVYPEMNAQLWIPRDFGGVWQRTTLRASHQFRDRDLFWYLDDTYLGKTNGEHSKSVEIDAGWHNLEIVDAIGQRDATRFFVGRRE